MIVREVQKVPIPIDQLCTEKFFRDGQFDFIDQGSNGKVSICGKRIDRKIWSTLLH